MKCFYLMIFFMLIILAFTERKIDILKKEIQISRQREELLAQAVKQIAYEADVVSQAYINEREK